MTSQKMERYTNFGRKKIKKETEMKCIIWKQTKSQKPEIYGRVNLLSEAKKILNDKYISAIELWFDEITTQDKLSNNGKLLDLFTTTYWIEKDLTL